MFGVITNRKAAVKAQREATETFQPGTTVGHRAHPKRQGTVSAERGRSIRIDQTASKGYVLMVFVVWEQYDEALWVHADDLTVI